VRVAVVALAVVAAAWYVVGIRQSQGINRANAIVSSSGHLSAADAGRASRELRSAAFLNPDRQVAVLRAQLRYDQGDLAGARAILKRVVLSEPDNLQAWILLARASVGDLKDFYAAAYRIRQLVPPVPPPP
jgi:predicted Zn-dependent protease